MTRCLIYGLLLLLSSISLFGKEPEWAKYSNEHFILITNQSEQKTREDLRKFEVFRAIVYRQFKIESHVDLAPLVIYKFADQDEYLPFQPKENVDGYYYSGDNGPVAVIGSDDRIITGSDVLYHEYLHYISRAASSINYPQWFAEGIAEFYSTLDIRDDFAYLGQMSKLRVGWLLNTKLLPLEELFYSRLRDKDDEFIGRFYATSWIVVHFFALSKVNGFDDFNLSLDKYLAAINQGETPQQAYQQSFSINLEDLEEELKRYTRKRSLKVAKLDLPEVKLEHIRTPMSALDAEIALASLAFDGGKDELGEQLMATAVAQQHPLALSYLAIQLAHKKQYQQALALIAQIETSENISSEVKLNMAKALHDIIVRDPTQSYELAPIALDYAQQVLNDRQYPLAYKLLADIYWAQGKRQQAINAVVALINLMPSDININLFAGEYMVKVKNETYARLFLDNVLNWSKDPKLKDYAKYLLAELTNKAVD